MSDDQNHEAFEKLLLPMQTQLRGYFFAATRDWAATDDLFQEVAMVLWRKYGEFDQTRSFRAWALGIARLQVLKRRQVLARSKLVFSEAAIAALAVTAGDETEESDWRLSHLAACMEKLPSNDRDLVTMRFEKDQPLVEIAVRLEKSVEAVGMRMMRIRRWLRDCMEKTMAMDKEGGR